MKSTTFSLMATLLGSVACLHLPVMGQGSVSMGGAGFREVREIRYPTEFDVSENDIEVNPRAGQPNQRVIIPPTVVPGGFETRTVGTQLQTGPISVSGYVVLQRSADGRQLVTLRAKNGRQFRVATGSHFRMGGRIFKALGFGDKTYRVQDIKTKETFVFRDPR